MFSLFRRAAAAPTSTATEPAMSSTVTISSATLDKPTYAAGETMTLTVVRSATATSAGTLNLTVNASDAAGTQAIPVQVSATIEVTAPEASSVAVTDSSGREWTKQSDDGATSVWTAVA